MVLVLLGFHSAVAQSDPDFEPTWYMVVDWANLLDEGQEQSAINDAWRLNMLGVPTQVVTEFAQSTPELANQRADQLRFEHGIETRPGADDGILIYAAVNPNNREQVTIAISAGAQALPHGGLTSDDLDQIASEIVLPQLTNGHPARAIVYSLREMIYRDIFTPPPAEPLDGWRSTLHSILPWVAPVVVVATALLALRGVINVTTFGQSVFPVALTVLVALMVGVLAVLGQSAVGAFSALALVVAAVLLAMVADRAMRQQGHRTVTASPRPPGRIASRGGRA